MNYIRHTCHRLLWAMLLTLLVAPAVPAADIQAVERTSIATEKAPVHPGSTGMHFYAVPVLIPGKTAWISIVDPNGHLISGVSVAINGHPYDSDSAGHVAFTVPNTASVSLALMDAAGKDLDRRDYNIVPGGFLCAADATSALSAIMKLRPEQSRSPALFYAPPVVQPGQPFVVLGDNLDTVADKCYLMLDGIESALLSGSPVAAMSIASARISPGPIKEMYLGDKDGESTNILEVDVARSDVVFEKAALGPGKDVDARLIVYGTNLPVVVSLINEQPSVDTISLVDSLSALGDQSTVLLPGGDQNALVLRMHMKERGLPVFRASIQCDEGHLVGPAGQTTAGEALLKSLYTAQLVKLQRRLISVENHISDEKKVEDSFGLAGDQKPADVEKVLSSLKALSLRQQSLWHGVNTRKSLFESAGGTEEGIKEAMDMASGGAYYVLERQARNVQLIPNTPIIATTNPAPLVTLHNSNLSRLLQALAEPRMKLLPPLDMDSSPIGQAPAPGEEAEGKTASLVQKQANAPGEKSAKTGAASTIADTTAHKSGDNSHGASKEGLETTPAPVAKQNAPASSKADNKPIPTATKEKMVNAANKKSAGGSADTMKNKKTKSGSGKATTQSSLRSTRKRHRHRYH